MEMLNNQKIIPVIVRTENQYSAHNSNVTRIHDLEVPSDCGTYKVELLI